MLHVLNMKYISLLPKYIKWITRGVFIISFMCAKSRSVKVCNRLRYLPDFGYNNSEACLKHGSFLGNIQGDKSFFFVYFFHPEVL